MLWHKDTVRSLLDGTYRTGKMLENLRPIMEIEIETPFDFAGHAQTRMESILVDLASQIRDRREKVELLTTELDGLYRVQNAYRMAQTLVNRPATKEVE